MLNNPFTQPNIKATLWTLAAWLLMPLVMFFPSLCVWLF